MTAPVEPANRVRGEWYDIRTDPEKKKAFIQVEMQDLFQAPEVLAHCFCKPFLAV